jgi:hypothetical protein
VEDGLVSFVHTEHLVIMILLTKNIFRESVAVKVAAPQKPCGGIAFDATFEVGLGLQETGLQPALPDSRQPAPEGPLPRSDLPTARHAPEGPLPRSELPMAALAELQLPVGFSPSPKCDPRQFGF